MKIKRNVETKKKFCEICPGTVFLSGHIPYMKTDVITTNVHTEFNVVTLETGKFTWFDDADLVCPCYDAELLIP